MALKIACSNPRFTLDFVRKCSFCVFIESTDNSKEYNLPKLFFVNKVRAGANNSLQYLIWLKSKTVKIYSHWSM